MTYRTTLRNALNSCSTLVLDGYEIEDCVWGLNVVCVLPDGEDTELTFNPDQQIEIDEENGLSEVMDSDGEGPHTFRFEVSVPMRQENLHE